MKYLLALSLWYSFAFASHFTGTYSFSEGDSVVTLILQHSEDGTLTGELSGSGERLGLVGQADADGAYGDIDVAGEALGFEAYLSEEDDLLGLYLFEFTADGEVDQASVQELIFERQSYEAALSPLPAPSGAQESNPLAQRPPASSDSGNPLGTSDPLLGRFSDGSVSLTLEADGDGYKGQLEFSGQTYPVVAQGSAEALQGEFESGSSRFTFEGSLAGTVLSFSTGGSLYSLEKQVPSANPLAAPANPLEGSAIRRPDPDSPIIARGQFAALSQDNALAFIEALEFALEQVGYTYNFTDSDRQQVLQAMTEEYPRASKEDQLVLARAREIWNRVQTNWASAAPHDQDIFILGVLTLAFGEETVQQNLGGGAADAGSAGCNEIEACMSQYNPEAYDDMVNASGCWASAGCTDYDSSTDTYTYEDYSPPYDDY